MINLLSKPLKMPCYGFNLPAMMFCPAGKKSLTEENAICNDCYALKGTYNFSNVKKALNAKAKFLINSLRNDNGKTFIEEMVKQITEAYGSGRKKISGGKFDKRFFRVHDSGDLFSPQYINCWIEICKRLPKIRFWFPTREYIRNSQLPHLRALHKLENVVVRPSALSVNAPVPQIEGLGKGTGVHTEQHSNSYYCPATVNRAKYSLTEWKKMDKAEQKKNSTCEGVGCKLCFIKNQNLDIVYLSH